MRSAGRLVVLLGFALAGSGCNRDAERREQARLAAEEEAKRELEQKLKESEARVSAMSGCNYPVEDEEVERKRRELQRQLADAERSAKASGKPPPKPFVPAPCPTPGDPLCDEPSARPAASASSRPRAH